MSPPDPASARLQTVGEDAPSHQTDVPMAQAPKEPSGINIPEWVLKTLPVIALLVGTIMVFAQQRADVDQLKIALVEIKAVQAQQGQQFVSKQVFDIKMNENEKYQAQLTARLDKIENLINGLYERLPAKHEQK